MSVPPSVFEHLSDDSFGIILGIETAHRFHSNNFLENATTNSMGV